MSYIQINHKAVLGSLILILIWCIIVYQLFFSATSYHNILSPSVESLLIYFLGVIAGSILIAKASNSHLYSLSVWLTTLVISPIFLSIFVATMKGQVASYLEILNLSFQVGFAISLPILYLFFLFVREINNSESELIEKKITIGFIGLISTAFPILIFFMLTGSNTSINIEATIIYCFIMIASIIIFKLEPDLKQ